MTTWTIFGIIFACAMAGKLTPEQEVSALNIADVL